MRTLIETYGPDGQYAILSRYVLDKCVWMGYKKIYRIVGGKPELDTSEPIELRREYKSNGIFLISFDGVLFSTKTKKRLATRFNKQGYETVTTRLDGRGSKAILIKIHRAVAIAFHGLQPDLVVNHKDGNKPNNAATNLEWVTHIENTHHAVMCGLIGYKTDDYVPKKLNAEQVEAIRKDKRSGAILGEIYGVDRTTINRIRKNRKLRERNKVKLPQI